jgi:ferritin
MQLLPHSAAGPEIRVSRPATLSLTAQCWQPPIDKLARAKEEHEAVSAKTIRELREVLIKEKDEHTKDLIPVFRHEQELEKAWV